MKSLKAKFRKSDVHEWNKNDERLLVAVEHGEVEKVASLLAKKGASAVKLDNEGKSALHVAATRGLTDCLSVILAHGADLSVTDAAGFSALHLAAKNNHTECVKKLIQNKCLIDAVDNSGRTALHYAAASGNVHTVQLLCEHKSPVNLRDAEGFSPLLLSARHAHAEVCSALLDWGADITVPENNGRTALMLASESSGMSVIDVLVRRGADLWAIDSQGHDVLHYAKLSGSSEVRASLTAALQRQQSADMKSPKSPQHDQVAKLTDERITTPKKRKAPPPPISPRQSSGLSSPSYVISSGTPVSGKSDASKTFNYKEDEVRETALKEQVEKLQGEKTMLLETMRQIVEQVAVTGSGQETKTEHGTAAPAVVSSLQAKISALTLENQQLANILKKRPSLQGGEDPKEDSRPNSMASNTSFHSTQDDFESPPREPSARAPSSRPADGEASRLDEDEEGDGGRGGGEEEIALLRQALESVQAKLLETRKENRSLQAQLKPGVVSDRSRQREEEERERERGREEELLESLAELQAKLTETQERYHQAAEEVQELRTEIGRQAGEGGGGDGAAEEQEARRHRSALEQEVAQLQAQLVQSGCEQQEAARRIGQLEDALRRAMEERESGKGQEQERRTARMEKLYKEAQEEIRMLQEALRGTVPVEAAAKDFEEMKAEMNEVISGLHRRLLELSHSYSDTKSQLGAAQKQLAEAEAQRSSATPPPAAAPSPPSPEQLEQLQASRSRVQELQALLERAEGGLRAAQQEVALLKQEAEAQAQGSVALADHLQVVSSLSNAIKELESQSEALKQQLAQTTLQVEALQNRPTVEKDVVPADSVSRLEHQTLREALEGKVSHLTQLLQGALRKQDEMALEAAAAWQEVRESRGEREALQELVMSREKENQSLSSRLTESQDAVSQLKQLVENHVSSEREKNKRIDDLSREVGKLKDALNSLSQMSYSSSSASKRQQQNQQMETLQQQIKQLQYQLVESKKQHHDIVSVYRMHLLYAVQGQMDEDVQRALKQILMMCKMPSPAKEPC